MKGIVSYGAYIPYNRLQRKKIGEFFGKTTFGGEKAVAGYDEDSVSMGVQAALDCLQNVNADEITSVFFATVSAPYKEKGSLATISAALQLNDNIQGIEATSSLRSGTSSLLLTNENERTLVISADCRTGAPSGQNEQWFGDGAAAFLIGNGSDVLAKFIDSKSVQSEIISQWRSQTDSFTQNWEERLGTTAFLKQVKQVIAPFLEKNSCTADAISKVIISGPGTRAHSQAASALGFRSNQVQDPLLNSIGAAGTAHASMMLISALETAKPGDKLLVVAFAEGLDVILVEVTEAITEHSNKKGIQGYLDLKNNETTYSDYLRWRDLLKVEPPRRPETDRPSAPALYRGYSQNLAFTGSKCRECGTPQFPKQRVCTQCHAKDQMEDYCFIGQSAKVATYTIDHLAASPAPPMIIAVIDFDNGGRVICEVTDCHPKEVEIGMNVELTFRRLYVAGGISNYFWKARPVRQKGGE